MKGKKIEKQVRKQYSPEFKKEALLRAEREGAAVAAKDLGLNVSQLYSWRAKDRASGQVSEEQRLTQSENARLKRELARLEEENAFLKKGLGVLREDPEMRYAMIKTHEGKFATRLMCRVLQVSSSGYYDWRRRSPGARARARAALDEQVKDAFLAEKCRAGAPRLTRRLKARGRGAGHNQIADSLRRQGLRARGARKFKATTNSNHRLPVAPNLLQQDFSAQRPNEKWVSDITYVATDEGWLYVAVVLDLYSRLVVGWAMSDRMSATLTCDALRMALFRRHRPRGVIVHSDRGSQYCSREYRQLLKHNGLICSMSARGDCYDNAAMESWNHSLKVEAVHGERFVTRAQAKSQLFEYIEIYYNRQRLHSSLGYLSPAEFELPRVA
nr:IS3 family transposase [Peristeroidobacter agariperforans]